MSSISRRLSGVISLAAVLAMIGGPVAAAPIWGGEMSLEGDIPLVINPGTPPADSQVVEAVESWRLGGENEDDPLLGVVRDVQVDDDGNIYLLDGNLSQIHVMSPAGEHLRIIGREGDGPGEFRSGQRLSLLSDGTVGVMEMMPGQIVVLQRDGTPGTNVHLEGLDGGMRHFQTMATDGHGLIMGAVTTSLSQSGATIRRSLSRFDLAGKLIVTLRADEETQSGGAIRLGGGGDEFTRFWTLCPDGRVAAYGREHDYRLELYGRDGKLARIVTRDYESLRRADEDIAEQREQMEEMSGRFGGAGGIEIDELERDISRVIAYRDGTLWVANSRGVRTCPSGAIGVFDVLDAEGRLVRTARITADYNPDRDDYVIRGDRLFVLKEAQMISTSMSGGGGGQMFVIQMGGGGQDDEDEDARPFEVICYDLPE